MKTSIRTPNSQRPRGARNSIARAKKEQRRQEAQMRQAEYDALTTLQKLDRLDKAFGVGVGATRERARLQRKLQQETPGPTLPTPKKPAKSKKS